MLPRWVWYRRRTTVVDALALVAIACLVMLLVFELVATDVRARVPNEENRLRPWYHSGMLP